MIIDQTEIELDDFQKEAIEYIKQGVSVIVSAPTGAGKTLIAEHAVELALKEDREVIYTAPIKALSNQKYRDFTKRYGDMVGILTGDVSIVHGTISPSSLMFGGESKPCWEQGSKARKSCATVS